MQCIWYRSLVWLVPTNHIIDNATIDHQLPANHYNWSNDHIAIKLSPNLFLIFIGGNQIRYEVDIKYTVSTSIIEISVYSIFTSYWALLLSWDYKLKILNYCHLKKDIFERLPSERNMEKQNNKLTIRGKKRKLTTKKALNLFSF